MKFLICLLLCIRVFAGGYVLSEITVKDGDTLHARIELGLNISIVADIRLTGYDSDEMRQPLSLPEAERIRRRARAERAKEYLEKLIEGKTVKIYVNDEKPYDNFGRVLAYGCYIEGDDIQFIAPAMINSGNVKEEIKL